MALTDIARQLKETFEGFGLSEHQEELQKFRELYGDAECIRIGEMDYIVINQVYNNQEYSDVGDRVSTLFYDSINNSYAIIDAETSSTLIDEVYSRVTYMQRVCKIDAIPDKEEIRKALSRLIDKNEKLADILIKTGEIAQNKANIFQCQLIKDTGVSAAPDVYSFMLKNGEIKEIADSVMRQIKRSGEVNLLKDRDVLEENKSAIQQAVFDKYINADIDIQNITVKSIFEISLTFLNIHLMLTNPLGQTGVFHSSYLASENNEFEPLNANIHVCNECGHELVDLKEIDKVYHLHPNLDAYDPEFSTDDKMIHAVGCEDCLERCPECGGWHFNYAKHVGSRIYEKAHLAPGREFIKGLRLIDANYCSCREGIEWVYDERSGTEEEHNVMKIEDMVFINCANEQIATYEDYIAFFNKKRKNKDLRGVEEAKFAKDVRRDFKKYLSEKYGFDIMDIKVSSKDKCTDCAICGGKYYRGAVGVDYEDEYRCNVCNEMISENRRMVTRVDGIIFMRRSIRRKNVITKYVMTGFGNLKKLSSSVVALPPKAKKNEPTTEEQ